MDFTEGKRHLNAAVRPFLLKYPLNAHNTAACMYEYWYTTV